MLTVTALKRLKPRERDYKISDRDSMYAVVKPSGVIIFRYDYRLNGRRETLTIGRFGRDGTSLSGAREQCLEARRSVSEGKSPALEKQRKKRRLKEAKNFGDFGARWIGNAPMAESTRKGRRIIYERDVLPLWKNRLLTEVTADDLRALCGKVRDRGAPATAIHVRDVVKQIFSYAILHGEKVTNPADEVGKASIATFVPKDRALSRQEIRLLFELLDLVTKPAIQIGFRLIVLTMVRKSELQNATWDEVDFESAVWTIPKERMKRNRAHNVYLSRQALEYMRILKTKAGKSRFLLPSPHNIDMQMSHATLNRVTAAVAARAKQDGVPLAAFTVHDLRRTGSTLLNELGFNRDWIEKCLAHEEGRSSRGVYNKAEYEQQRRHMLQEWADMIDSWVEGQQRTPVLYPPRQPVTPHHEASGSTASPGPRIAADYAHGEHEAASFGE
ncbi:site-specific integrase [Reyranella sp.]|uniref:tyrosine-type recombinase/integrase n=1 Tax=Reyranella sp. TaxID=1929291 RepID=UPI0009E71E38